MSTLMSGTVVAQAITIGFSFALTRLYAPEEYGRYAIFMGCAAVLATASTGAFDRVIILEKSRFEARRAATMVLVLAFNAAIAISIIGMISYFTGLSAFLPLTDYDLIIFIPTFMICYAGAQIFLYASLREDRIKRYAGVKVGQSLLMGSIQVGISSLKIVPGLIIGTIAGWLLLFVAGLRWRLGCGELRRDLKFQVLRAFGRRYRRYPRYIMPNEVLDSLSNQAPVFLIGTFVSLAVAGHYGLALLMLSAPAAVAGQAVAQVFMQYMGRYGDDPVELRSMMVRIWLAMVLIGLIPFGIILFGGDDIFGTLFGSNWTEAGRMAQCLSVLLLARFASAPTSTVYLKLGMQREQWHFCLAAACYRIATYGLSAFGVDIDTILLLHVVVEVSAIVLYNLVALRRLYMLELISLRSEGA
ncbi:MAG: lipopolysaccharide biosynthesis protein [Sphingopyxis solisilvae]|uniref:lipopolysaccharide biosynthesis protein n=1 Tax=Sphingopyxis solisilvae TaxID=1886788 RepID=UPI00403665BF